MKKTLLFFLFLLPVLASAQTDKLRAGIATFSGFAVSGAAEYTGDVSGFLDVWATNYRADSIAVNDLIIDATGHQYRVDFVNTATPTTASIVVISLQAPHKTPVGRGVIWEPIGSNLMPPAPWNNLEITPYLRSLIDGHNIEQLKAAAGVNVNQITVLGDTASYTVPNEGDVLIKSDSTLAAFYNGTQWLVLTGGSGGGGGADDWGSQVVQSDATLTGDGTAGSLLGVNTSTIATTTYADQAEQDAKDYADANDADTQLTQEQVEDFTGGMVTASDDGLTYDDVGGALQADTAFIATSTALRDTAAAIRTDLAGGGGSTEQADGVTILGDGSGGDPFRADTSLIATQSYVTANDLVDDADADPLNELDTLTLSNDTLYAAGPGVYLPYLDTVLTASGVLNTNDTLSADTSLLATQSYLRTYHADESTFYLANDTLADPVVFTVDTIKEINVLSYESVPTGISSIANIAVAPVGRYMFHLRNTDAQNVDFPPTFKLANGDFADEGGEHFLFKDQMWDCYSDGLEYHCNTPTGANLYDPFVFRINTENPGVSGDSSIFLPFEVGAFNDFEIDWGDGVTETITNDTVQHTYASPDIYNITIRGIIGDWAFANGGDKSKMVDILEWGDFTLLALAFQGCDSLDVSAADAPQIETSTRSAFQDCVSLTNMDASTWDMSSVTNINSMFQGATEFNGDVSTWLLPNCTSVASVFQDAENFNQPIDGWGLTDKLTSMSAAFRNAKAFNQSLNSWDVSNVPNMGLLFDGATAFNGDISSWTVTVTGVGSMFRNALAFNQPINHWDVSGVTNMNTLFNNSDSFNQPLDNWDVSGVTTMSQIFRQAESFNQDISNWDVSNVGNLALGFFAATDFNQPIYQWDVSGATSLTNFASSTSLSNDVVDSIYIEWTNLDLNPNLSFSVGSIKYTPAGQAGRNLLTRSDVEINVSTTSDNSGEVQIDLASVHGLSTGDKVYISGVGGTTEANGGWIITVIDTDSFTLDGSTYANAYTSGGTARTGYGWTVTDGGLL